MSGLLATETFDLPALLGIVIVVGVVLLVGGKRLAETLLALDSEILTLLILLALAILAGIVLGAGCKDILANLISGLLGFLTKSALTAYKAATAPASAVPPEPGPSVRIFSPPDPEEEQKPKEAE